MTALLRRNVESVGDEVLYKPRRRRSGAMWAATGGRVLLWALVIAGVLSGVWAMRAVREIPEPSRPLPVLPMAVSQSSMQFVERWLRASDVEELAGFVKVSVSGALPLESVEPTRVWVADAAPFVRGWEVVVAAEFEQRAPGGDESTGTPATVPATRTVPVTRWYRVEMLRLDDAGRRWQFAGLPAAVAAPITLESPTVKLSEVMDASDPRVQALQEWLSAYLTGSTDPTRWLASGAWSPGPPAETFDSVELVGAEFEGSSEAPTVTAEVVAYRGEVATPMSYHVALVGRGDRWEITEVFPRSVQH